jgi:signal transduction histidine kinase
LSLRSIERVLQGGRHLLHIINDSLELSRYEANQIKLNLEWIDVPSMMASVSEILNPLAQAKGLQLKIDGEGAPEEVFSDSLRLQQILINLLSNAIRYTEIGSIRVICQSLPDQKWSVAVSDTGIGIAPEDRDQIFKPYSQAFFNQGRRHQEGTGLGLAIVSRLVQLLQGEIELVSELGVGSTFTVILPLTISSEC